jgi:hypothetical protein
MASFYRLPGQHLPKVPSMVRLPEHGLQHAADGVPASDGLELPLALSQSVKPACRELLLDIVQRPEFI